MTKLTHNPNGEVEGGIHERRAAVQESFEDIIRMGDLFDRIYQHTPSTGNAELNAAVISAYYAVNVARCALRGVINELKKDDARSGRLCPICLRAHGASVGALCADCDETERRALLAQDAATA